MALAFVVVMLGATLPTPLYPLYEAELGFGQATVTVVFAAYAVGVVAALLLLGRASDVLGRRRLMLAAVGVSALSSVVFVTSPDLGWLYLARVLSGVGAGIVTTTGTVYLVELAPDGGGARASLVATVVNMLGLGLGPALAGLAAEVLPAPLVLPYAAHLALCAAAAAGLLTAREVVVDPGGSWRPARPRVAREARGVFVPAAVAAFAAFAAFGLTTGATAGILGEVLGYSDLLLVGLVVLSLFAASAAGQVLLRGVPTRTALRGGCIVLAVGASALGASLPLAGRPLVSLVVLVLALVIIGAGQSLVFRAGIAELNHRSPETERAATVTSFFLVAYVGISVPVVLLGAASLRWGLQGAALGFSAGVALLALVSLAAQLALARRAAGPAAATAGPEAAPPGPGDREATKG